MPRAAASNNQSRKAAELYDLDFAEWARTNAELLRSGRFAEIDLEHVAEEIEDLGTNVVPFTIASSAGLVPPEVAIPAGEAGCELEANDGSGSGFGGYWTRIRASGPASRK